MLKGTFKWNKVIFSYWYGIILRLVISDYNFQIVEMVIINGGHFNLNKH